jgi:hypothetical protein
MGEATATKLDVVLFPCLAIGHLIPYLELAMRLAARGHAVTFLSMPRNVARLPPVPPHLARAPRGAAAAGGGGPARGRRVHGRRAAADERDYQEGGRRPRPSFAAFLADAVTGGRRPDWIVHDFCHRSVPRIAGEHGVPCAAFLIVQATTIAFLGPRWAHAAHPRTAHEDFTVAPKWCPSLPPAVAYRRHEADWAVGAFQPNASGVSDMDRTWEINERTRFTITATARRWSPGYSRCSPISSASRPSRPGSSL